MTGRMDGVPRPCTCTNGKNPRNRKQRCPKCNGTQTRFYCPACNEPLPCKAEVDSGIMDLTGCPKEKQ